MATKFTKKSFKEGEKNSKKKKIVGKGKKIEENKN